MQISTITSSIIIYATYYSYKKNIHNNTDIYLNLKDKDKQVEDEDEDENLKKVFKAKSYISYISLYRIAGYIVFIYSLLYLMDEKLFNAIAYMIGISVLPISIIITLLIKTLNKKEII
jgi:hypothetical protein